MNSPLSSTAREEAHVYSWIWRKLPGSSAVKVMQAVVLVTAVIALLLFVVFPWLEPRLPFNAVTTGS